MLSMEVDVLPIDDPDETKADLVDGAIGAGRISGPVAGSSPCRLRWEHGRMPTSFEGLDAGEARAFAERWLPAWTGNDAERLAAFYAPDAHYRDESIPDGID